VGSQRKVSRVKIADGEGVAERRETMQRTGVRRRKRPEKMLGKEESAGARATAQKRANPKRNGKPKEERGGNLIEQMR
jgi:hypothetical protein